MSDSNTWTYADSTYNSDTWFTDSLKDLFDMDPPQQIGVPIRWTQVPVSSARVVSDSDSEKVEFD